MRSDRVNQAVEAIACVRSGDRVFVQGAAAAPRALISALTARAPELRDVEIVHLHTEAPAPYAAPEFARSFRVNALFVGANLREAVNAGRADYVPVFLSEVPALFRKGVLPIDVALVHVSEPDRHGYCSLGVSVDVARAAVDSATHVVAQINPRMPRTHGDGLIHRDRFSAVIAVDESLPESAVRAPNEDEIAIGRHVASVVENGSTLQLGIGAIPNAVLSALGGHAGLGIHSEMFSDGVLPLIEAGVITGEHKRVHPGKVVAGFVVGSRRLYDFVDDNLSVAMLDIGYVNDTDVIRRNPKVVAINSAIEVDLSGQVCADSIGTQLFSGVGGQMDFIRGASLSDGGRPIIALPATTSRGASRIVASLKPGAGVVTTRAHVHFVATEFGIVNLHGRNLRERARLLIGIAHPAHREALERAAHERGVTA